MILYRRYIWFICIGVALLACPSCICTAEAKDFVIVIDAGHGGHDPGAVGRISKEKNINLKVALKLGRQIEQNCPDVRFRNGNGCHRCKATLRSAAPSAG